MWCITKEPCLNTFAMSPRWNCPTSCICCLSSSFVDELDKTEKITNYVKTILLFTMYFQSYKLRLKISKIIGFRLSSLPITDCFVWYLANLPSFAMAIKTCGRHPQFFYFWNKYLVILFSKCDKSFNNLDNCTSNHYDLTTWSLEYNISLHK